MSKAKVMKAGRNPFSTTLGQFETGDAPQNYTNLTFFPSQQLDKLYIGSKVGDTDIAQMRLANEELFRKDPFYQAKLNLLNPLTSATKYIENKSFKEMQEELLKEKYRELKNRKKLLKGVPEQLQQPLLRVIEEAQIRPSTDTRAVLNEITGQLVASGDIDDRQARDLRHFAENALRTTLANREAEDREVVAELGVARETVRNALRAELGDIPEDELSLMALRGIDSAVSSLRDLGTGRNLDRLVSEGLARARGIATERRTELTDLISNPPSVVDQDEDIPLHRTDIGDEGRGFIGEPQYLYREARFTEGQPTLFNRPRIPDIWGFDDDEADVFNNFETGAGGGSGIRVQAPRSFPSLRNTGLRDEFTGLPQRQEPIRAETRNILRGLEGTGEEIRLERRRALGAPARQTRRSPILEGLGVAREAETRPIELMIPEEFRRELMFRNVRGRRQRPLTLEQELQERRIGAELEPRGRGRPRGTRAIGGAMAIEDLRRLEREQ
jgi:hypothetical protein